MDETGILVFIGLACALLAVVSGYLIYKHVQDEKEQVYRASVRREKDQLGPSDYLKEPSTPNRKRTVLPPVVAPPSIPKEEELLVPDPIPEPDPLFDPIVTEQLPPEPESVPDPLPDLPPTQNVDPVLPVAVAAGVAAGAAVVAAKAFAPPPPPPEEPPPEEPSKKQKKRRGSTKTDDFEDYTNFAPKALPPPKSAAPPPAAKYDPPTSPVYIETEQVPAVSMRSLERAERSTYDREGLRF